MANMVEIFMLTTWSHLFVMNVFAEEDKFNVRLGKFKLFYRIVMFTILSHPSCYKCL
jgi:hypothetical protein